jgi:hypothetical protein
LRTILRTAGVALAAFALPLVLLAFVMVSTSWIESSRRSP